MKTAKFQITFSIIALSVATFFLWLQFKPSSLPPMTPFQVGQEAAVKQIKADAAWYRQADAHGVSYKKYTPMEIAASNATIYELNRVAKRPDWDFLTVKERTRITGEVDRKADEARQIMRDSYYTKPFKPDW